MAISLREFTDINPPMFQDREAPPEVAVDEVSITPEQPKSTVSMGGEAGKYLKEMQPFLEAEKKAQADKDIFASELKGQELASQAKKSERMADVTRTQKSSLEGSQEFQDLKQAEDELMKKGEFVPTQDTAKDIAGLFSLVGVIGFAIGGSGKNNAIQAMSAMNGMLSGYQKGRSDLYKREKDIFDTNMKALQIKTTILSNRLKQVAELYALDAKAGDQEADALFNKEQATFYKQYKDKFGLPAVVELSKRNTEAFKDAKNYELRLKEIAARKSDALKEYKDVKGQMYGLMQNYGFDQNEVQRLGGKEIAAVASTIESAKLTKELADDISKLNAKGAGVVSSFIQNIDKYLPQQYQNQDAQTGVIALQNKADQIDVNNLSPDEIAKVRSVAKKAVDVINARALAASGGSRVLVSELYLQKGVIGVENLSPVSAISVYNDIANRDINVLSKYGVTPEKQNFIRERLNLIKKEQPLDINAERQKALNAIKKGANQTQIKEMFKRNTGQNL